MFPAKVLRRTDRRRIPAVLLAAVALTACGESSGPVDVQDPPPAAPDLSRIEIVPPVGDGVAGVVGSEGAVEGPLRVRVVNTDATLRNGGESVEALVTAQGNGSFKASLPAEFGDGLELAAIDADGNESDPVATSSGPEPAGYTGQGVGDVQIFPLSSGGALSLPFESGAERYVVIAQSLNPSGQTFEVKVTGAKGTRVEGRALVGAAASLGQEPAEARIRELERRMMPLLSAAGGPPRALAGAQDVGDEGEFFALNRLDGFDPNNQTHFDEVEARLRYLGSNTEVWVDVRTPSENLPEEVLEGIGDTFDDQIHPTNRSAFGEESDVDGNGRVIILLTPTVNGLNTQELVDEGVAVLGFFFGPNLAPKSQFPFSNEAEMFYAIIPDPDKEFSPAEFGLDGIGDLLSGIFAHEFEHMISANQHILLRNGSAEQVWLDEGLAHYAETLNGFHLQNRFLSAVFLDDPESWSLTAGEDTLERRGAAWLFVNYLVERFGEEILGQLVQTRFTGVNNVESVTDLSLPFLLYQWASALFLDGTSDDPLFHFPSFDLRQDFVLAKQQLTRPIGDYLGVLERTLVGPATAVTLTRDLSGHASGYFEVEASSAGDKPIVLRAGSGSNLQAAVFRIE